MFKTGDKIGIVCCSNGRKRTCFRQMEQLKSTLEGIGLQPVFSKYIFEKEGVHSGDAEERANALMDFYRDDEIKGIFDISGGDIANGILPYLNYEEISSSSKLFWGYSDLTTVLNAVYAKTGKPSVLYQLCNVIYEHGEKQIEDFRNTVFNDKNDLFDISYRFIQGKKMDGIVVGGNIRCFLKLAGTAFMPDFKDKILLLESCGGTIPQIETYLCQLEQMKVFDKISGILLGTFTQMEKEGCKPYVETMLRRFTGYDLPIAVTKDIGHGTDAKGIMIGKEIDRKN